MPQTNYADIHIPVGCTVLIGDHEDSLVDLGVIPMDTDSNIHVTYDTIKVQGSKRETVLRSIRNMKAAAQSALYQVNLSKLNQVLGGIMTVTSSEGAPVGSHSQQIAAGWTKNKHIALDGQNADGGAPTVSSVKNNGSSLSEGTDYMLVKDASGRYGIVLIGETASTSHSVTVTYSYTPAAYKRATMGGALATVTPKVVRFLKEQNGKKFQVTLFAAMSTDGLTLSFPGADNENPPSIPFSMEGDLDTSRADGEQLLEIIDEIGALA